MLIVKRWDADDGPLQLSALRRELQHEGLNTAWWSEVPGMRVEEHEHPFPESRWVLSGYLRVYVGDEVIDLGPGERLDLPPGTRHGFEVIGLEPAVFVTGSTQPVPESLAKRQA
jgi:quercetin dioxygenase-like cupin family protein